MNLPTLFACAAAVLGLAATPAASAHARLESSSPQANAVVSPAPAQVRLQFSDRLELPFSKVKLVDQAGAVVAPSRVSVEGADSRVLVAAVPALHAGAWRVQWSVVTRDGHRVKGEYAFKVK